MNIKIPIIIAVALVALAAIAGSACAMDAASPISLAIEGVETAIHLDHGASLMAMAGQATGGPAQNITEADFNRLEDISGLYVDVDEAASNNDTIQGWFLLLNSPFYVDGDHSLKSMYGTFSRDLTDNKSRPEYHILYTGVWQWLTDPVDQHKVMIRLGEYKRVWWNLWMVPLYFTTYDENVHISNVMLNKYYKKASVNVLDHDFEKIYV
jgi:hypothetical protein